MKKLNKKTLITIGGILAIVAGVAGFSAYEAHVINVTAHIENALAVSTNAIEFGTVFPQEYLEEEFTVRLSSSFMEEDRVDDVEYVIKQKPKCINQAGEYAPVNYATHECPTGYTVMNDLCAFLSKTDGDLEDANDTSHPSYYVDPTPQEPMSGDESCVTPGSDATGRLSKIESDTSDLWIVDLKVPPVDGYVGQDWPAGCPVVDTNDQEYGCDLWIEVTDINYDDTDVANLEIITLTDLGAVSQYGYYHNYAGANVTFQYTTPDAGKITGTVTATGLKPYATYQLKFEGKPTCMYGVAGDNVANENVGYMGRWWDNTTNSNTNDAGYVANHTTHCITGYLVWGYITADASGNVTKIVTTDSSYHVLWSGGGICDTVANTFLAHLDAAHPTVWFSPADKVNGEIERGSCYGMTFISGTYKLGMSLTEESFHQGPGTWTTVMIGDIEFEIN